MKNSTLAQHCEKTATACLYAASTGLLLLLWLAPPTAARWGVEDGPAENLSALLLVVAAVAMAVHGIRLLREDKRNQVAAILALLAAAVFVVLAGEEISWGQRIFGIESGDFMQQHNWQGEVNLHNLHTDIANIAFHYGAFIFLIVAPLFRAQLVRLAKKAPRLIPAVHFIPPAWIAVPSFAMLGMLDSRFSFMVEKPWAASFYLAALATGLCLLLQQLFAALRVQDTTRAALLAVSLVLIGIGLYVSYVYGVDKQATNIISEYKELFITGALCTYAIQWKAD